MDQEALDRLAALVAAKDAALDQYLDEHGDVIDVYRYDEIKADFNEDIADAVEDLVARA